MPVRPDPETLNLFRGALDFDLELRRALTAAIDKSGHSREFIAAQMSELTASKVTHAMLDSWTAETRTSWNFPVKFAVAFDVATRSSTIAGVLARKLGCRLLSGHESIEAELGRIAVERSDLERREARLLSRLNRGASV